MRFPYRIALPSPKPRFRRGMAMAFLALTGLVGAAPSPAEAKPVSVKITKIACASGCRNEGLEAAGESAPDFYAKIWINGVEQTTMRADEDSEAVSPDNLIIVQDVPDSMVNVPVAIQIWDHDGSSGDDLGDSDPNGGDANLDFTVNLNTGLYTGDVSSPGNCATGNGEPGGSGPFGAAPKPPVFVCFEIGPDGDGDGLLDAWETNGIDFDGDGTVDLALNGAPFNARPGRKDLFVEVDWMACAAGGCTSGDVHTHAPQNGVLTNVVNAFAAAPVPNPDGSTGITLHAMSDEAVPDLPNILFSSSGPNAADDFDDVKNGAAGNPCDGFFGTAAERGSPNCANILGARRSVFRYAIFGHNYAEASTSSGRAELGFLPGNNRLGGQLSVGGNDFIVTLGGWSPAGIISVGGQATAETGTFMHELGHTLSLQHGGVDGLNCKPNYLSIMNYTLQFPNIDLTRPLDFTSQARGTALGNLNESNGLDENVGIAGPAGRSAIYGVLGVLQPLVPATGAIDWDGSGGLQSPVSADVNFINTINDCDTASPNDMLRGFDDWANLAYNFRNSPFFSDGVFSPGVPELTNEDALRMNPLADLEVKKAVDRTSAIGGDTLTYPVTVTNLGPATAVKVSLVDFLPDGSSQTRALPNLDDQQTASQTFSYAIPCSAPNGALIVNRASVSGTNPRGFADPDPSNDVSSVSTTVRAPVLMLEKTATETALAGEAVTYTLTYENSGAAEAAGVTIVDKLSADLYYSLALDQGAGPKPSTVTKNADGTTTLVWTIGSVPANSGLQTITYTARTSLLTLVGTTETNVAMLSFKNANGCSYADLSASAVSTVTAVPPTQDPHTLGYWRTHPETWTDEILARIQATDQRFDGANGTAPDGLLDPAEATAAFAPPGGYPRTTAWQLLATYFNLATRRINAGTSIVSRTAAGLGLTNVREAALNGQATLALPVGPATQDRYKATTTVLDEINQNKSEVY